jgi:hypothetical protein
MPGIPPSQARDFFRAAARYYRATPWRTVDEGEPIKVASEAVRHDPWIAVILGKRGKTRGLMLHDDWESYRLMAQQDYSEIADQLRMTGVHFEALSKASPEAKKMVQDHRLELASSRAYPSVFRMGRGRQVSLPDAPELDPLEACLWVTPDFLHRAKVRSPDVFVYNYKGISGMMTLELSWVPGEQLHERDRPTDRR